MAKEQELRRSWQEIAEELVKETNGKKAVVLADKLDRAIERKLDQARKASKYKQGAVARWAAGNPHRTSFLR